MSTKYVKFKSVRDSIVLKQDTNIEAEIEVVELGEGNLICEWWIELRDFKVYSEIPDWLIQQTSTSLIQALKLPVSCLSHIPDTDVAVAKIVLQTTNFDTGEIIYVGNYSRQITVINNDPKKSVKKITLNWVVE